MTPLLAGVAVLDLSIWRPGPYATSLLCGLGADVLKVEPPGGDPMRHYADLFEEVNRGKRSVVLDLASDDDRERAWTLAGQADVIVEGFRPGVLRRFGLDEASVRARHPRMVYCSVSGYGQEGVLARLPGHDINYQAWAGSLAPDGGAASMPPLPVADLASGMTAAFGICAALLGRGDDGPGTYLDVSMTDVMATWTGAASATDEPASAAGSVPGYGLFTTSDGGQVALGVVNEQHLWSSLCHQLGLAHLADIPFNERMTRNDELTASVRSAIGQRRRDDLVEALLQAGAPVAPVHDRRAMKAHAPVPSFPIRLGTAVPTDTPAPALDQHRGQGFHGR